MRHEIELPMGTPLKVLTYHNKNYGAVVEAATPPFYQNGEEIDGVVVSNVTYEEDMVIELDDHKIIQDSDDKVFETIVGARPKGRHGG